MKVMKTYNKLALEPYKGSGKAEAVVSSGFASIKQRSNLIGLKLLCHADIQIGDKVMHLNKGDTAYFVEEVLHASPWTKKKYQIDGIEGDFIIASFNDVAVMDENK